MLVSMILIFSFSNYVIADCPDGSFSIPSNLGSPYNCILLLTHHDYFTEAEEDCMKHDGHLLPVPNGYVNMMLANFIVSEYGSTSGIWIGVTNIMGGVWRNIYDGSNATYFNWASGEPQNGNYPICIHMKEDGLWYSGPCYDWWRGYFCGVPGSGELDLKKDTNATSAKIN